MTLEADREEAADGAGADSTGKPAGFRGIGKFGGGRGDKAKFHLPADGIATSFRPSQN